MRHVFILFLAVSVCTGSMADAGAWLRDKGTGFASLSFGATRAKETTNALYFEYGLSEKTTIGVDISAFTNGENIRNGFGNLFIRRGIGPTDRTDKFSYELGVGGLWENDEHFPALKTKVSWGRGFELRDRSGWVNVDATYVYEPTELNHITKLDATAGYDFGNMLTGILEVNLSRQNNNNFGAIEPSLLIKPKSTAFQFKLGAQIPLQDNSENALKLGIWRAF